MALTVVTIRPNATVQTGVGTNTVVGAANAHTAWSDNSDSSYVQLTARCRNDTQVVRVTFPTPTIPAGAKVLSVGIRRRVLTVVAAAPQPVCLHWLRTLEGLIQIFGQVLTPYKDPSTTLCPTDPVGGVYTTESLGSSTTAPSGAAWNPATNLLATNFAYDYGRGDDIGGNHRISEVYADVTYQQVSTVAVTAPTGTVATTRPTITWTYTSPDSQPQQGYRAMIYTAAQVAAGGFAAFVSTPLIDSGDQLGEDLLWTIPIDLADGTYSAYVRAVSKWSGPGDFFTAIASTTWTRTVAAGGGSQPPAVQPPNATLSSATFDGPNDRVVLTMVPSSASPATAAYTVQISRDGGVTWGSPDSLSFIPATGMTPVVRWDYLAPIGATSQYRVLSYSLSSGIYVAAAAVSNTISVLTSGLTWRLADPLNPVNNCVVIPVAGKDGKHDEITFPRIVATFQTLGGGGTEQPPIVVNGPTSGEAGVLNLLFIDSQLDNWPLFRQQLQSGHTLLLKKSFAEQKWVRLAAGPNTQDPKLTYDAVPGRPDVIYWRRITIPYSQVRPPSSF